MLTAILLIGGGLLVGGALSSANRRTPRRESRDAGPVLNPRTERPWCEMLPVDFTTEDRANEAGMLRWSRCSTTTREALAAIVAQYHEDIDAAQTDADALSIAQRRDRIEAAWRASHNTEAQSRADVSGRRSRRYY